MVRFEHSEYLWWLFLVVAGIVGSLFYHRWKEKKRNSFAKSELFQEITGSYSKKKTVWKNVFFFLSMTCLIIALVNPQYGSKLETVRSEGADIMIALDVSNSMNAQDISPTRLEHSKREINQLIHQLNGSRIGIVVFAGQAYVQLPITMDYSAAKLFLPTINSGLVPVQGTAIGSAIDLCVESFDKKSTAGKAIIVISDGENHEDDAVEAAKEAKEQGMIVYTIGMGSTAGAPIPIYKNGQVSGYLNDENGNGVVTKMNPEMLSEVAQAGGGSFVQATNSDAGLGFILSNIDKIKKSANKSQIYSDFESRYQFFMGLAILFLMLDLFLATRKSAWIERIQLLKTKEKDA